MLTIARYSAAISGELGNTTGCRRGEIAGRWTKPVAATQLATSHGKPSRSCGPDLGNCIQAQWTPLGVRPMLPRTWLRVMKSLPKRRRIGTQNQTNRPVDWTHPCGFAE